MCVARIAGLMTISIACAVNAVPPLMSIASQYGEMRNIDGAMRSSGTQEACQ
jgi:hypothetical protein